MNGETVKFLTDNIAHIDAVSFKIIAALKSGKKISRNHIHYTGYKCGICIIFAYSFLTST